ncbi:MAG: hypothetical protein AABW73_00525 [Nanoarchaeota archaeon]
MKEKEGLFYGGNSDQNRQIIENKKTKFLVLNHSDNKRDSLYERDSGLNQVLCKIAKQKGVSFIINLEELKNTEGKMRAETLARIIQNIMLINKFGNKTKIIYPKNWESRNVQSFLLTIGSSTNLAKNSTAN